MLPIYSPNHNILALFWCYKIKYFQAIVMKNKLYGINIIDEIHCIYWKNLDDEHSKHLTFMGKWKCHYRLNIAK